MLVCIRRCIWFEFIRVIRDGFVDLYRSCYCCFVLYFLFLFKVIIGIFFLKVVFSIWCKKEEEFI